MALSNSSFVVDVPAHGFPVRTSRDRLAVVEGCIQQGDLAGAEQACTAILGTAPSTAEAWFFLGLVRQRQETFDEAADHYEQALILAPRFPEARNNLGVVLQGLGKIMRREACFREALRLDPDYPEAFNNLGNTLQEQGKLLEAEYFYRQAALAQAQLYRCVTSPGECPSDQGREKEAIEGLRTGLRSWSPITPRYVSAAPRRGCRWANTSEDGPSMSGGSGARANPCHRGTARLDRRASGGERFW